MAAREVRASPRRLLLLTASVAVGVAALVAINSFTDEPARLGAPAGPGAARRRPLASRAGNRCRAVAERAGRHARVSRGAKAAAGHQLRRDGLRPAHRRNPAGAGGGDRGRLSVLRRDQDRSRGRLVARCSAAAMSSWIRRCSPRSVARSATRSRWARRGSSSPEPSRARPATWASAPRSGRGSTSRRGTCSETGLLGFGARAEYEAFLQVAGREHRRAGDRQSARADAARRAGSGAHRRGRPERLNESLVAPHRLSRPGRPDRAPARRHRRGERGGRLHPPAAGHDRGAPLPRRHRRARARRSTGPRPR